MTKILEGFENRYGDQIKTEKIDLMSNMEYAKKYNVRVVPTLVFLNPEGEMVYRHEGLMTESELVKKWEELGHRLKED